MKTSNRLLIMLAALLIIIPIIVVAVNTKLNYVSSSTENFVDAQDINSEPLEKEAPNRSSIFIKDHFSSVNIPDGKRLYLELHFIKSAKSGLKVPTDMKDDIKYSIDNNSKLQISFNDKLDRSSNNGQGVVIVVYGPNINELNLNNSSSLVLTAKSDTLNINAKNAGLLTFGSPITFFNKEKKVTRVINKTEVKDLNISLDSTTFNSTNYSYHNLTIQGKNSSVEIEGDKNNSIEKLTINTAENSEVRVQNIKINDISGDFSDNTKLDLPVSYLKKLFKK